MFQPNFIDKCKNFEFESSVLEMCEILLNHLITLEFNEPKLDIPLCNITQKLPVEMLTKIIKSKRISKIISNSFCFEIDEEPSKAELMYHAKRPYTMEETMDDGKICNISCYLELDYPVCSSWSVYNYKPGKKFALYKENEIDVHEPFITLGKIVAFSIFDYRVVYNIKYGYRGTKYVIKMLEKLHLSDEKQACAWLVQLAYDTDYEVPNLLVRNTEDLYGILKILVDRAIEILRLIPQIENYEIELNAISREPFTHMLYNDTMFILNYWNKGIINEWSLKVNEEVFILSKYIGDEVEDNDIDGYIIRYSIYDHINMYISKGRNGKKSARNILTELLNENVDINNYKIACSWIVQLSYDSKQGSPKTMNGYQDLKTELNRLINIVLSKLM
jgi:hypothetical protein